MRRKYIIHPTSRYCVWISCLDVKPLNKISSGFQLLFGFLRFFWLLWVVHNEYWLWWVVITITRKSHNNQKTFVIKIQITTGSHRAGMSRQERGDVGTSMTWPECSAAGTGWLFYTESEYSGGAYNAQVASAGNQMVLVPDNDDQVAGD